jgi:hypothetical protein
MFPSTALRSSIRGTWHPDDYVIQDSEVAKHIDEWLEIRKHQAEEIRLLEAAIRQFPGRNQTGFEDVKTSEAAPSVFVEPLPRGGGPITGYQIEFATGEKMAGPFRTQEEAIEFVRSRGSKPLVARVRISNRSNPNHWRAI